MAHMHYPVPVAMGGVAMGPVAMGGVAMDLVAMSGVAKVCAPSCNHMCP